MEIRSVGAELKPELETYYYPRHIAVWKVTFRTIFGTRRELVMTVGDGVTGYVGIVDEVPEATPLEVDEASIIPEEIESDDFYEKSKEALRKYFIYKRRVWKVPIIECDYVDAFHVPYQVERRTSKFGNSKYYLYEPMSKMYEDLKKHEVIKNFVLEKGEVKV
ncbi:hypothetical protein [Salinicoccus kekensis]|uniref:Uncharacterized protein n=1 Tax=Salinicoccus kekensis TaxID=714307 RepID=A0A285UX74_9STAP|nr:hypothetical protein [Salinicoccus kekensis]SOC44831.1 hypothetical protein SAMN05878391_2488 [Salinicoccus kekensis]